MKHSHYHPPSLSQETGNEELDLGQRRRGKLSLHWDAARDLGLKRDELWTFPTMDPPGSLRLEFTHCLAWVSEDVYKNLILDLCIWVLWGSYLGASIFTSPSRYSQSISSCVLASALRAHYKSEAPKPDGSKHSLPHFKDILVSIRLGIVK